VILLYLRSHLIIATGAGSIERLRISNAGAATFAGTITAPSYAIYRVRNALKLMVQLIQHLPQHLRYNCAGTIARFKSGGGLEISQITESAICCCR
jgi:hypothetical protein